MRNLQPRGAANSSPSGRGGEEEEESGVPRLYLVFSFLFLFFPTV